MRGCLLLIAVLSCATLAQQVNGQHYCLRLSHCASVEADLRGVNGTNTIKYMAAADAVALYKKHLLNNNGTFLKICKDKLKACVGSTSSLAVKNFKFPRKYRSCEYVTYSKAIFGCKNIANWLPAVTSVLAPRYLQCRFNCIVNEEKPVILGNGMRLLDFKNSIKETELEALTPGGAKLEGRIVNSTRRIDKFYSTGQRKESEWGVLDTCQEGSWAYSTWICYYGDRNMPNRLYFGCTTDGKEKNFIEYLDSTQDNTHDHHRDNDTKKLLKKENTPFTCGGGQNNSLMVGIELYRRKTDGLIKRIDYLCAQETTFKKTGHLIKDMTLAGPPIRLICRSGTAICSIQVIEYKQDAKTKMKDNLSDLFADLRIGCCGGNPRNPKSFENVVELERPGETPDFCHRTNSNSTCNACDRCQCCRIVDTVKVVTRNQTNFLFTAPVSRSTEHIMLAAISEQLQPSKTTNLNWKSKIDDSRAESYPPLPPIPNDGKFELHYVWRKFTASCNGVQVVYFNRTIEPVPICIYFGNCTTEVPSTEGPVDTPVCETLMDQWDLIAEHISFGRSGDDGEWGPPYYRFDPHINSTDGNHNYMKEKFIKHLSKSPRTGFDWGIFFRTVRVGPPNDTYTVRLGEVPKNYLSIFTR